MTLSPIALLAVLLGLQIKHFAFDFVFQTNWQVRNKGIYGHPGGIVHAGLHGVGTLAVFAAAAAIGSASILIVFGLAIADFVIHYHVDWIKAQLGKGLSPTAEGQRYWITFGLDQAAHHATYLGLVLVWALAI